MVCGSLLYDNHHCSPHRYSSFFAGCFFCDCCLQFGANRIYFSVWLFGANKTKQDCFSRFHLCGSSFFVQTFYNLILSLSRQLMAATVVWSGNGCTSNTCAQRTNILYVFSTSLIVFKFNHCKQNATIYCRKNIMHNSWVAYLSYCLCMHVVHSFVRSTLTKIDR